MKFSIAILFCFIGFLTVHSSPIDIQDDSVNKFFDSLLDSVKSQYGKDLDPLKIPEIKKVEFNKKIGAIKLHGEAKLFDGELKGLKSLHRSGNCLLKKETDGFTADVKLELDNLDFHFKAEVKLDKLHKDVLITGHTDMIEVEANAHMNTETNKADLKEFKVLQLKKLHVNIHGLSVLDPILNAFTNVMIEALNPVVKGLLEKEAKNILSEKIKNIKIGE